MKFTPKSETEVNKVFENGTYQFEVISAIEKNSKSGNPMMHLKLKIFHDKIDGKTNFVDCYLLTDNPNFEFMLRHFCFSIGIGNHYEKGEVTSKMCENKGGLARIVVESDKEGKYPDKNKVSDFIVNKDKNEFVKSDLNDDVPF